MRSGTERTPSRLPRRVLVGVPLGTVFIGSTLVAFAYPAIADTPPLVTLAPEQVTVEPGETATMNLTVDPATEEKVCVLGAEADNGFTVGKLSSEVAPAEAPVSGTPKKSLAVTATVTYATVAKDAKCADVPPEERSTASSTAVQVVVEQPDPSPTPTQSPTTTPSPSPTDEPTKSPTPTPTPSPTDSDTPTDTPTDDPTSNEPTDGPADPPEDTGGSDGGGGDATGPGENGGGADNGDGSSGGGQQAAPHSGVNTDPEPPGGGDPPDLPTDLPELPSLDNPASPPDDLAELPTVQPGEDGSDDSSPVAAGEDQDSDLSAATSPAVLLLFLLLLLLFAAPLAPTRRVRAGAGYRGRRRRT